MKRQIALALIATALIVGLGVGYIWVSAAVKSQRLENCTVTGYAVWLSESIHNGSTSVGSMTNTAVVTIFQTTGYPNTTINYATTLTGAIASWNGTTCS